MMWLILVGILSVLIYWKVIKPLSYWEDHGVMHQRPWPLVGNLGPTVFRKMSFTDVVKGLYNAFPDKRYNGIYQFTQPMLLIRDIELIKQVAVKDFDHFMDHNSFVSEEADPLMGKNLFSLKGQRWRDMRATLSPSFTSSKMKAMFGLLSECAQQFVQYFEQQDSNNVITVEMKDTFTRFTNDAIASIAFGLKCDSLEERENEFYLMGKDATNFTGTLRTIKLFIINISPALTEYLKLKFFATPVANFFRRIVKETIKRREEEGIVRPDMIHLLMEAQKGRLRHEEHNEVIDTGFATAEESFVGKIEKHQKAELTDEDITAQVLIFLFGGFETSATLMSFTAYELAVNPDVQEKLQCEIDETLNEYGGKITYEGILRMKYLDMVVSETLRKWPPGFQLDRRCVKDYVIKPTNPSESPFTVKKGMLLSIPVIGIHHDPKFFPNPDTFDPDRFSEGNKQNIQPYSYLPFGVGPRNCVASRFALLENKTLFFHLLAKFDIVVVEKTPVPLKLGRKTLNMMPDEGFWLGLQPRNICQN